MTIFGGGGKTVGVEGGSPHPGDDWRAGRWAMWRSLGRAPGASLFGVALVNGALAKGDVMGRGGRESAHTSVCCLHSGRSVGGSAAAPPDVVPPAATIAGSPGIPPSSPRGMAALAVPAAPVAVGGGWDA